MWSRDPRAGCPGPSSRTSRIAWSRSVPVPIHDAGARAAVLDGVLDEVEDDAEEQRGRCRAPVRGRRSSRDGRRRGRRAPRAPGAASPTTRGQVDGLGGRWIGARVGAGQEQQVLDQARQAIDLLEAALERAPVRRAGGRGGQRDLQLAAQDRERRAQLVRGVGAELPRRRERPLEASQHVVQHGGEPAELVVRRVGGEPPRQVLGADAARRLDHGVDRRERAAGEEPAAGRGAQRARAGSRPASTSRKRVRAASTTSSDIATCTSCTRTPVLDDRHR